MKRSAKAIGVVALAMSIVPANGQEPPAADKTLANSFRLSLVPAEPIPLPHAEGAATADQLTLTEVEEMAVAYHPAVREGDGQVRAARGNWLQVGLKPNPEIGYSGNEIGDSGAAGQQGGFVSQEFVTAGKLGLNREVAAHEVAAAEQRLARARLQVITSVRTAYFEALAAERAVALAGQLKAIAAQAVHVSELRLQAMEGSRASVLQSQIESESASLLEQQATNRREAAWRRLSAAIGMEGQPPHALEDSLLRPLPDLEWAASRQRVLAESPEVAELRFAVERAKWAVQRATAGRVPNVNLQAGVALDNATNDTIANVQVSMPLPLFDRKQGAIAQACGELTAAQAALEQKELALEQRLAAAMRDYATPRERVARYTDSILPAARESLHMINKAYEQGELDYLQVLAIQQTYAQKNLAYLQDLETAWKQWAEIEGLLVGQLPDDSN